MRRDLSVIDSRYAAAVAAAASAAAQRDGAPGRGSRTTAAADRLGEDSVGALAHGGNRAARLHDHIDRRAHAAGLAGPAHGEQPPDALTRAAAAAD